MNVPLDENRMRRMRGFVARYPRDRSRCIKIRVMLRRLVISGRFTRSRSTLLVSLTTMFSFVFHGCIDHVLSPFGVFVLL
jgi:hypothetical protein